MNTIKTRFAPSPTGFLHIGGLRTALYAYLLAKKEGGNFVLRIEDTDRTRLVEGAVEQIVDSLHWADLDIHEGVTKDESGVITQLGECGPYIQSERLEIYQKFVRQLIDGGHAYYAFDTPEELDKMRERQQLNKQATRYERDTMVNQFTLGEEATQKRIDAGEKYVVRLKVLHEGETSFHDAVRGEVTFKNAVIDDQVLLKADGFPTYHLAVVVDDRHMEITHVIRGEEWLSSTPKHIMLYNAFGWDAPVFAHLPLMVNEKKQKLSKRHGDVSLHDFVDKGYLKEALVNFIAFVGWSPGTEQEIFTLDELVQAFSLEKVSKSAAFFNREKLAWYNKQYMMAMDLDELAKRALPFFRHAGIIRTEEIDDPEEYDMFKAALDLERSRVDTLADLAHALGFIYSDSLEYDPALLVWKKDTREGSKEMLGKTLAFLEGVEEWTQASLEEKLKAWIKENEFGVGNTLWPMRIALSGQKNSPGPFEIAAVLGKEKTLARMRFAEEQL